MAGVIFNNIIKRYIKRIKRIKKKLVKKSNKYKRLLHKREAFLERNDERLKRYRSSYDRHLSEHRSKVDERISGRREKIEIHYIELESEKLNRLHELEARTDAFISQKRNRQDERIKKHRELISMRRQKDDERYERYYRKKRNRILKRLIRLKNLQIELEGEVNKKRATAMIAAGVIELIIFFIVLHLTRNITVATYEYATEDYDTIDVTEEQYLWNELYKYFDGNETAVLSVMCNLKAESKLRANNLEDINNEQWNIDDETYTDRINKGLIFRKDFLRSKYKGNTNGYYNDYNEWVNTDGGYGYAQYTSYENKEKLYAYAKLWFGKGGRGEDYRFNMADVKMQTSFITYLLSSPEYKQINSDIRNAQSVVDGCYIWLKYYEIPYDPYGDDYYTLAFDRAASADEIIALCKGE